MFVNSKTNFTVDFSHTWPPVSLRVEQRSILKNASESWDSHSRQTTSPGLKSVSPRSTNFVSRLTRTLGDKLHGDTSWPFDVREHQYVEKTQYFEQNSVPGLLAHFVSLNRTQANSICGVDWVKLSSAIEPNRTTSFSEPIELIRTSRTKWNPIY